MFKSSGNLFNPNEIVSDQLFGPFMLRIQACVSAGEGLLVSNRPRSKQETICKNKTTVVHGLYSSDASQKTSFMIQNLSFCLFQTFLAPINQVFPAEDDVNKHVEDNCEFLKTGHTNRDIMIWVLDRKSIEMASKSKRELMNYPCPICHI